MIAEIHQEEVVDLDEDHQEPSAACGGLEDEDQTFFYIGAPEPFSYSDCSSFAKTLLHQFPKISFDVETSHVIASQLTFRDGHLLCRCLLIQKDFSVEFYINSFKYRAADVPPATVVSLPDSLRSMIFRLLSLKEKIGLTQPRQTVVNCRNQLLEEATTVVWNPESGDDWYTG